MGENPMSPADPTRGDLRAAVAGNPLWYHTMDLGEGVTTPGWFDLRPVVDQIPWPDVRGKRCLDVGTYDGFLAFELEQRGAGEVIATDIASHEDWDWPIRARSLGVDYLASIAGAKGHGFEIAAAARESRVERRFVSIYDLPTAGLGTFDVVVCGALLLHLRDPFQALESIRQVCTGWFLSVETIDGRLGLTSPRRPALRLSGRDGQWMIPNAAGHQRMLDLAGFDVVDRSRRFATPLGAGHPARTSRPRSLTKLVEAAYFRGAGVGTQALLSRPAALSAPG